MLTVLVFALVIVGVILVPTLPLAGFALIGAALALGKAASGRDEDRFMAVLVILGGAGAAVQVARYFFTSMP